MSGLLVKSTVIMKENLEEMNARGVAEKFPVLLGGAALTRSYVENDLSAVFKGDVRYARDAFEGLRLMDGVMSRKRGLDPVAAAADAAEGRRAQGQARAVAADRRAAQGGGRRRGARRRFRRAPTSPLDNPIPTPPFWGSRVVKGIALADYSSMLDERATFMGQWGLRGAKGGNGPSYEELVEKEGRPRLRYWLERLHTEQVLQAAVVYGYFPCVSEGDEVVVLAEPDIDAPEVARFSFPRQRRDRHLCLADFYRPRSVRRGRRHRLHRGHHGPADRRLRQRVVRRQRLSRLPRGARTLGAADRGARRVLAPADPVRAGLRRRHDPPPPRIPTTSRSSSTWSTAVPGTPSATRRAPT